MCQNIAVSVVGSGGEDNGRRRSLAQGWSSSGAITEADLWCFNWTVSGEAKDLTIENNLRRVRLLLCGGARLWSSNDMNPTTMKTVQPIIKAATAGRVGCLLLLSIIMYANVGVQTPRRDTRARPIGFTIIDDVAVTTTIPRERLGHSSLGYLVILLSREQMTSVHAHDLSFYPSPSSVEGILLIPCQPTDIPKRQPP